MTLLRILGLALVCVAAGGAAAFDARAQTPSQPDMIVIDGKKNPELLPQYVVWENVLSGLARIKAAPLPPPPVLLKATPADRELMFAAGGWYRDHQAKCMERQRREVDRRRSAKRPREEQYAAQRGVILQCRQDVLDRVDALLPKLSEEGRFSLLALAEEWKSGMWSTVPRSELEFYRKPR